MLFSSKQQRVTKATKTTLATKLRTSNAKKYGCIDWLCLPLVHTHQPYLYNSTLISLQLFKPTPISLQLDLWLTWTLSHDLYLFELLTWSYSDSNSTWSPPQLGFQLNQIPHPWTLLGSDLVYSGLDSSLLKLKVLIPPWSQTPFQFRLVSLIFFLSSSRQLTRAAFTLSAYPISLPESHPNSLPKLHPSTLPEAYPIASMLTRPYMFLPDRITLPDSSPDRTSIYLVLHGLTQPNYLT
jgi:hypothetical protein